MPIAIKIGTHVRTRWIKSKLLGWTDILLNQSFLNPTKHKSVARSHPSACPTSSAITNCRCVPGFTITSPRNKQLNRTTIPTLIQNDRGNARCRLLVFILQFILLYSRNIHWPMNLLTSNCSKFMKMYLSYTVCHVFTFLSRKWTYWSRQVQLNFQVSCSAYLYRRSVKVDFLCCSILSKPQ